MCHSHCKHSARMHQFQLAFFSLSLSFSVYQSVATEFRHLKWVKNAFTNRVVEVFLRCFASAFLYALKFHGRSRVMSCLLTFQWWDAVKYNKQINKLHKRNTLFACYVFEREKQISFLICLCILWHHYFSELHFHSIEFDTAPIALFCLYTIRLFELEPKLAVFHSVDWIYMRRSYIFALFSSLSRSQDH